MVAVTLKGTGTLFNKNHILFGCGADTMGTGGSSSDLLVIALTMMALVAGGFMSRRSRNQG